MTPLIGLDRAAEWVGYQLAVRPALRRVGMIWLTTHILSCWALIAAPRALAYPVVNAMSWTGIADSHGVPLGAYYLSTVSTAEAITEAGPDLSLDPSSWAQWLASAVTVGISHDSIASMLQLQASIYIIMLTLALWLLRFVMSSVWLHWLATWFRPLFDTLQHMVADLYLFPICLVLALAVGGFHVLVNNHRGHGWRVILSTLVIAVLGWTITRDPVSELASENGMLTQARNMGLTVSSAALNNGGIAPGGGAAQMNSLIQKIADATVRMPLQLFNFGTVVDHHGSCANAWSAAIMSGDPAGPAHAMRGCGAPQALAYAAHLDGASFGLGTFYLLIGAAFSFFVLYVAYSYIMVACAAFINAIMLLFAAPLAMIDGAPRQRALHRLTQFFRHVVLVFAYVLYISFAALIVLKMAAPGGYAAQVGMTNPVALLFMVGLLAVAATGTFIWLKRQLGDHTRQTLTQKVRNSVDHGKSGYAKGQRAETKINKATAKLTGRGKNSEDEETDTAGNGGGPLTGPPSPGRGSTGPRGRRGGRRPATLNRTSPASTAGQPTGPIQRPAGAGTAPSHQRPTAASLGKAGKTAAMAAAKVAAPEAAGIAAFGKAAHLPHPDGPAVAQGRNGNGSGTRADKAGRGGARPGETPIPEPYRGTGPDHTSGTSRQQQPEHDTDRLTAQEPSTPGHRSHEGSGPAAPAQGRTPHSTEGH